MAKKRKTTEMMFTIGSDDEIEAEISADEEDQSEEASNKSKQALKQTGFAFDFDDEGYSHRRGKPIVAARDEEDDQSEEIEREDQHDETAAETVTDNVRLMPHSDERALRRVVKASKADALQDASSTSVEMNAEDEAVYFDSVLEAAQAENNETMFSQLSLSRALLRGVEAAGYVTATPIQASVIPLAMAGRDVCASAVTGSGKTAAFVLPFLERLLYRRKDVATIRVLVVSPTRELATQIYQVLQKLSQFTDITSVLICGGKKDLKSQEAALRLRPDVVVGTPGRIIDHLRNSQSVNIDDLDVLVLDEVDRLLDLGFQEEVEELVRHCPTTRQTLLFSATMTPKVEDLAKLSLRKPVRVKTSSGTTTVAPRLVQEFVKVRNLDEREGMITALVCRSFPKRTIVFFETKKDTHRFYLLLLALGVKVSELHGDVTQAMRYVSLEKFRSGAVDVMVATDVAARGLDIPGVQTVINQEMPRNASTYVHRVGRTARAGCGGRSVTLVSDARRKVMKEVLKNEGAKLSDTSAGGQVLTRTIPPQIVSQFISKIAANESKLVEMMKEERLMARVKQAEEEAERAVNLMIHEDEISARPARTWYQTETQKHETKTTTTQKAKEEAEAVLPEKNRHKTADEKARSLAFLDDYRREEGDGSKKDKEHRLSRKKRRRNEAIEASRSAGASESAVEPMEKKKAPKPISIVDKENSKGMSLADIGAKRDANRRAKSTNPSAMKKVTRQQFAVGGLDADFGGGENGDGMTSKERKVASRKAEKEFTEFDASKRLRKGGKIGAKSFKSKSKFKRR